MVVAVGLAASAVVSSIVDSVYFPVDCVGVGKSVVCDAVAVVIEVVTGFVFFFGRSVFCVTDGFVVGVGLVAVEEADGAACTFSDFAVGAVVWEFFAVVFIDESAAVIIDIVTGVVVFIAHVDFAVTDEGSFFGVAF